MSGVLIVASHVMFWNLCVYVVGDSRPALTIEQFRTMSESLTGGHGLFDNPAKPRRFQKQQRQLWTHSVIDVLYFL
jgi:hypothetical protein